MDQELLPETTTSRTKWTVGTAGFLLTSLIVAAAITGLVKGTHGQDAILLIALSMFALLTSTAVLLRWALKGQIEDRVKYIVAVQVLCLIFFSVGVFMLATARCPDCVCPGDPACYTYLQPYLNIPWTVPPWYLEPSGVCFGSGFLNNTICINCPPPGPHF